MTKDRRSMFRCVRLAAAALALGVFGAGFAPATAQDASPVASPMAVACVSPGLPPGTPTPMDDMAGMDMGTPAAEGDMGTPIAVEEAEEDVTGTMADEATAATIIGAIENYFACYNEGQATGDPGLYVALESPDYHAAQGYTNVYDRVAEEMGSPFPVATLLEADNAMVWEDGRVSADVQFLLGDHWYNNWRIFLADVDGMWLYDEEAPLPPTPDVDFVAVNGINIVETTDEASGAVSYEFVSFSGSWDFAATDAIVFNFTNSGAELHEAVVVQLPEGADPLGLLDGSVDFSQVTFLGAVFDIPAGGSADLTFLDLPVGTYTMLCFYPGPDGAPHAVNGMIQQFNIVEPAA